MKSNTDILLKVRNLNPHVDICTNGQDFCICCLLKPIGAAGSVIHLTTLVDLRSWTQNPFVVSTTQTLSTIQL